MLREWTTDQVTWLCLDRPERLNSFTVADYRDLREGVERAVADPGTRVIVVTGTGRAFSAGADRSMLERRPDQPPDPDALPEFKAFLAALYECEKPLLAAVNGYAVGIGCTMLLHFDLVTAAESATFRMPFTSLGILPEAASSVLLPTRVRWDDAMWALLSSEWIDATAAHEMGLVWRVFPDAELADRTADVARTLASLDPDAVVVTKRLVTAGRSDVVRMAIDREMAAMGDLSRRRSESDNPQTQPEGGQA